MRKGRIIKSLAVVLIAVLTIGCFSITGSSTQAADGKYPHNQDWSNHIDIRFNASMTEDAEGNYINSGVTIDPTTVSVKFKTANDTDYKDATYKAYAESDAKYKYEVKFVDPDGKKEPFFQVTDGLVINISGEFSNGETIGDANNGFTITQDTYYPSKDENGNPIKVYIEYVSSYQGASGSKAAMKVLGRDPETLSDGKQYFNVSGLRLIDVAVAMCNGASVSKGVIKVCGLDFYLNPEIIKNTDPDTITVTKNWTDLEKTDDTADIFPSNVTVELYKSVLDKDGNIVYDDNNEIVYEETGKTTVLNEDNGWTNTIKYKDDGISDYTVKEIEIDGAAVEKSGFECLDVIKSVTPGTSNTTIEGTVQNIDISKDYRGNYKVNYSVANSKDAFAIVKRANTDKFAVWTKTAIPEENRQAFLDVINAKGDIEDVLTVNNCEFESGLDATFEYPFGEDSYSYVANKDKVYTPKDSEESTKYKTEDAASTAMNEEITKLHNNDTETKYVEILSSVVVPKTFTKIEKAELQKQSKINGKTATEQLATQAMNGRITELKKNNTGDNYPIEIVSAKTTHNNSKKKWGYIVEYIDHSKDVTKYGYEIKSRTVTVTPAPTRTLSFKGGRATNVSLNFSNRDDWSYVYSGTYKTETTRDVTNFVVPNKYLDSAVITGTKTFDMQGQDDIDVPADDKGPNITLNVYKNGSLLTSGYSTVWSKVEGTDNKWTFTITGDAITTYYDKNEDEFNKSDSYAKYVVKEADSDGNDLENNNQLTIGNFNYTVTYSEANPNDITNTLDTSGFTGDLVINKTITNKDDVNAENGKAIFTYKIEDEAKTKTYYAVIVVDPTTHKGTATLKGLKIGNYTVTELDTMRYAQASVSAENGVVTVEKDKAKEVNFANTLKVTENFSHTDVTVNSFTKTADGIDTNKEDDDNVKTVVTYTKLVTPAYR